MNTSPLEFDECVTLVEYLELLKTQGKVLEFSHTANETYTKSWNQKRKNTSMGVKSGLPDYIVVTHKQILFIEMKRVKGGTVSQEQKNWVESINKVGGVAVICKGFDEAKQVIDLYI